MLVTASHQADQDVFVSFNKETLKQIASVAADPLFSNEANWVMVSIVFKHNNSAKRLVSGFKNDFTKTDNVKLHSNMVGGEIYELHEILISGTDRQPILSIKRAQIANAASMDLTLADGTVATVTLSSASSFSVYDTFSVTATFNKSITGFISDDITVSNASISNFSGSGSVYTFDVTPSVEGEVTVQIGSSKVDGGNSSSNIISRNYYSPVFAFLSSISSANVLTGFSVTATFASDVTGFSLDDLSINNCTVSNLSGSGSVYTFDVSPTSAGTLTLQISSGSAQSIYGANSLASNTLSRDYIAPISVALTSSATGSNVYTPFSVTATFQDNVTGFSQSSLSVVNATVSNFSGSGNIYTFTLTPTSTGSVSVQVPSNSAYSPTTSAQNSVSNTISFQYYAPASVTLSSSSSASVSGGFTVTATFSEAVAGFTLSDLDLVNCTASLLEALTTSSFQFYLTPTSEGTVSAQVKSNAIQTFAAGAGNTVSNTLSRTYLISATGWVGANNGVWSTASNWSPQVVPNSTVGFADISRNISGTGSATLLVDSDVTVNKLKFSATTTQWTLSNSNSKSLTLGGTSPTLESSMLSSVIHSPTIVDGDLTIKGTSNYYFGYNTSSAGMITANNKNIVVEPTVESMTCNYNNLGTWVGGTLTFSKVLRVDINSHNNHFGGATGPKIIYKNNAMTSSYSATNSGGFNGYTVANQFEFSDIGNYNFRIDANLTGTVTGTVSKSIYFGNNNGGLRGNISGLNFVGNGKLVIRKGAVLAMSTSAMNGGEISICDSTDSATLNLNSYSSLSYIAVAKVTHAVKVRGSCTNTLSMPSGSEFAGSIVLNPEGTVANGSIFSIASSLYGSFTVSGVISDGGSNAQNITLKTSANSGVILSGQNTYSCPTLVDSYKGIHVSGALLNSDVTIASNGAFYLTGSCKSVTNNGTSYGFYLVPMETNSTSTVGTMNGNLVNTGKMIMNFASLGVSTKLVVNGNVTLGGTIAHNGSAPVSGNSYVIMQYTGTRTGTFATNSLGAGTTITYDDANKRILVTKA